MSHSLSVAMASSFCNLSIDEDQVVSVIGPTYNNQNVVASKLNKDMLELFLGKRGVSDSGYAGHGEVLAHWKQEMMMSISSNDVLVCDRDF